MKLNPGDVECKKCNGVGLYNPYLKKGEKSYSLVGFKCPKCLGTGKFDWIEVIVGKREIREYNTTFSAYNPPIGAQFGDLFHNKNDNKIYLMTNNGWTQLAADHFK